jgi:hypothetical protein
MRKRTGVGEGRVVVMVEVKVIVEVAEIKLGIWGMEVRLCSEEVSGSGENLRSECGFRCCGRSLWWS